MRSSHVRARSERRGGRRGIEAGGSARGRSWRHGSRLVLVVAVVAAVSLGGGLLLSRFVISPAELAAGAAPPVAGPITAPIEQRVLENAITSRADVTYADAVDVKVDSTGLAGPAVVTGRVPEVGSTLDAASVALEVAGRPLIVLPGDLPVYRTLHVGLSGPDVLQLKAALSALGIDPGDAASDLFDSATSAALDALYRKVGYPSPPSSPDAQDRLASARSAVENAGSALRQAQTALSAASRGATASQRVEADNAVREAQRALATAQQGGDAAEIERCQDQLDLALARRDELLAPLAAAAEQAGVDAAGSQLASAESALAGAEKDALTVLPSSEVVYLAALPRRVDSVTAERGAVLQGAAMAVSGARLQLAGTVSETDAALLKAGMPARFTTASGNDYTATVSSIAVKKPGASGSGGSEPGSTDAQKRYDVLLDPQPLSDAEVEAMKGSNVKLGIPVQSTSGAVLAAPVAALSAGAGGESRVELVTGTDPATGRLQTELAPVTTGLSAGGFVEVNSKDPRLIAGAIVVVGR